MPDTPMTPDIDDLHALLDLVPIAPFELIGADFSERTVSILFDEDTPRAELETQAQATMALLMDLPTTLRGLIAWGEGLAAEVARLRPMEAALAAVREYLVKTADEARAASDRLPERDRIVVHRRTAAEAAELIRDEALEILGQPDGGS